MTDESVVLLSGEPAVRIDFRVRLDFLLAADEVRMKKDNATLMATRLEPGPDGSGAVVIASDGARVFSGYDEFGHVGGGPVSVVFPKWFLKLWKQAKKGADQLGLTGDDDGRLRVWGHAPLGQEHVDLEYSVPFEARAEAFCSRDPEWLDWRKIVPRDRMGRNLDAKPNLAAPHAKGLAQIAGILSPFETPSWVLQTSDGKLTLVTFDGEPAAFLVNVAMNREGVETPPDWEKPFWS